MSKYSMIKEALTVAKLGKSGHLETLREAQKQLGKPLHEVAELLPEAFSSKITPADYDEWIRQVVMQSEDLKADGGTVNLNRRSVFNDLLGDVLENDPAGKVNLGDDQLVKHVFDATWKRYQGTRDHLKAQNVMKAREEEELLQRQMDVWAERGARGVEDEERNVMAAPQPEETDEFEPMSGRSRYDDEDMTDELPADDMEMDAGADVEGDAGIPEECPFDEGTPECDAWMAGYSAAMQAQEEGTGEEDMGYDDMDYEAGPSEPEGEASLPAEQVRKMDSEEAPMSSREPEMRRPSLPAEDEEQNSTYWRNAGYKAAKAEYHQHRKATPPKNPFAKRQWERGYESFMGDTEGQRELARRGAEDEETSIFKSVISKPRDTLNQALKSVEDEGASAFDNLKMPGNPHPNDSLAQKAWAKGFKNAVRNAFGFEVKPAMPAKKRKR
jgi:hypothetical protein